MMTENTIKVGDRLAVPRVWGRDGWDFYTVSKITPAGLLKISYGETVSDVVSFTLNRDLTIRGDRHGRRAEPINDEIREWKHREELVLMIGRHDMTRLPTVTLEAVLKLLRGERVNDNAHLQ